MIAQHQQPAARLAVVDLIAGEEVRMIGEEGLEEFLRVVGRRNTRAGGQECLSRVRQYAGFRHWQTLVRIRRKKDQTELAGKIRLRDDYDHEALRDLRRDLG